MQPNNPVECDSRSQMAIVGSTDPLVSKRAVLAHVALFTVSKRLFEME